MNNVNNINNNHVKQNMAVNNEQNELAKLESYPENVSYYRLKHLFPSSTGVNINADICITNESINSVTAYKIADDMTSMLLNYYYAINNFLPNTIIDTTANIGGNCLSFARNYVVCNNKIKIIAYEIKQTTSILLKTNLLTYKCNNVEVINADFTSHILYNPQNITSRTLLFIDPPWFIQDMPNHNLVLDYVLRRDAFPIEYTMINIWAIQPKAMIAIKVEKDKTIQIAEKYRITKYKKMDILIFHL